MNKGLEIEGLTKSFGQRLAVDHLNFSIAEPGVFGLIGTNGAGKTTTIRMILGILTPDEGSARWDGRPIDRETLSFGYMPEERGIYMKTKVLEQLIYFGMLRGMPRGSAKASALRYLQRLGVEEYKDMPAEKLSKGNQQKIQLIATLIHEPKLIFLDEPFSGLDPVNADMLRGLIRELVDEGRMIVMSSHQMATVEEYCRDLALLHHGQCVLAGNLQAIKAGYGHTNLIVAAEGDVAEAAQACGLTLLEDRADEKEYKITGDAMAQDFLRRLVQSGVYPTRYEIKEPSLHEIFIEKVGAAQ